jgi:hypothetical protein
MVNDIRKRAPFYLSDWTDAWNYRVVPATVYIYFAKSVNFLFITHPSIPSLTPVGGGESVGEGNKTD